MFLKNKLHFEGKPGLLEDRNIEEHGEEFVMEFNAAKKGMSPITMVTGATVNLQRVLV